MSIATIDARFSQILRDAEDGVTKYKTTFAVLGECLSVPELSSSDYVSLRDAHRIIAIRLVAAQGVVEGLRAKMREVNQ